VFGTSTVFEATTILLSYGGEQFCGGELAEFNKIIDDLANIDVNLEDEDKAFHLLCALPRSLENFKDVLLYGK
ncbi:cytochrome P450, partial [Trifolium medium]|nr:cytochrome P450 [Trifolium medium]